MLRQRNISIGLRVQYWALLTVDFHTEPVKERKNRNVCTMKLTVWRRAIVSSWAIARLFNCAVHKLGKVVLVRTRPNWERAASRVAQLSLWVKSHVRNAFSRGSPRVPAASNFSLRLPIRCVMLRTSTWYCNPSHSLSTWTKTSHALLISTMSGRR